MNSPRLDVDLSKIRHNTRTIVERLKMHGIRVTTVTKAVCGHPAIAQTMLDGGAVGLADARLSNVKRLRMSGMTCPVTLIRTPMLSQVDDVVNFCEASYNTEIAVITALAASAIRQNEVHGIILMVELGDLREGIMPHDLGDMVQQVVDMPGVSLKGIGANFACLSGVAPTAAKMRALSDLSNEVEARFGATLQTVSGGNSANLPWALAGRSIGRINDLRIGEAILLGVDPITGDQIEGLFQDAFTLVAEVIETDVKSTLPFVSCAENLAANVQLVTGTSETTRVILGLGQQDVDAPGLLMPPGNILVGATSDHLVVGLKDSKLCVGSEMKFQMNYGALMRAMAAPDVHTTLRNEQPAPIAQETGGRSKLLACV